MDKYKAIDKLYLRSGKASPIMDADLRINNPNSKGFFVNDTYVLWGNGIDRVIIDGEAVFGFPSK